MMERLLMSTTMKTKYPSYNQDQIKLLCDSVCDKIEDLLEYFEIEYKHGNDSMLTMCCPIHDRDNASALNLYHEGDHYRGNWKCRTHGCEKVFKASVIGFIRGVLSHKKYDWQESGDQMCSFKEAIDFASKFVGSKLKDYRVSEYTKEKKNFAQIVKNVTNYSENPGSKIDSELVQRSLRIPSEYYINRGYSPEILTKYDIGLCDNPKKEMKYRVVAPIYDSDHQYVVGCTGRSIFDKCSKCNAYHDNECPDEKYRWLYSKWRHSSGFKTQDHLYNMWFARPHIQESNTAIIVESPGNVWKLEENGIHNSVAIFGTNLSDRQKILLDGSGAMSLIIIMDNDEAGKQAAINIINKCNRTYKIHVPSISKPDIGEMTSEEIDSEIKDFMMRLII